MKAGWYISGAGHVALIILILFGGLFAADRLPEVTVAEVSMITEAEFAALTPKASAPEIATDAPAVTPPAPEEAAPEAPAENTAPEVSEPAQVEVPETPAEPVVETPTLVPEAEVQDQAPVVPLPPTDIDGSAPQPDAVAAPAPRVAPVPQVAPPPVTEAAPQLVEDTAPAPEAPPEPPVEEEKPAAPEEASDRIVTEAEEVKEYAPASSMRPKSRPAKPVRTAEKPREETREKPREEKPRKEPKPEDDPLANAVAAALAEANQTKSYATSGPPLTGGEKDALRVAVSQCWNVGSLSTEALGTTVVVSVTLAESGVPDTGSIRMISSSGGSETGARQAFEAARRAIIRCGSRGFPLPVEKYDQWREIEMTFNPEGMQFR